MPAEKSKLRQSSKPLMEKRRRARINDSLMQLKALVLDALNKNNSRHSKLEKADILEMTVRYLGTLQRQHISASANADPAVLVQYRSGYAECINEVTRYLGANSTTDNGSPELRNRLVGHLANLSNGQAQTRALAPPATAQQHQSPVTFHIAQQMYQQQPTNTTAQRSHAQPEGARIEDSLTTPVYNTMPRGQMSQAAVRIQSPPPTNNAQMVQSIPLGVTGSLPSGEITLVIPQQALSNGQIPTHLIPVYAPAGSAVLSHTSSTNTNIQSRTDEKCHVSMCSPRVAAAVPALSPTGPQSSMTIPAQHAFVAQPPVSSAQVAYCVPVQTQPGMQLSPAHDESTRQPHLIQPAHEPIASVDRQCLAKNDPMWRPWLH